MTSKRKTTLLIFGCIFVFFSYKHLIYEPGYCPATQRLVTDAEFIKYSMSLREGEIANYGGIDAYEKHFIRLNRHPEEAGRDFDANDPNCCKVYRGKSEAERNCGIGDYPICVRLHFPPLKELPKGKVYYKREGRTYLFDDCGKLRENY